MTIAQATPKAESGIRAGTQALTLLSLPINVHVLQALADGPRSLTELRRAAGSPPATTMRGHLRTLTETGAVTRRRQSQFPGTLDYELTPVGRKLLAVADVLGVWLASSPERLTLGTSAAKGAIKALLEGWATSMLRALAARPLSLTELDRLIVSTSYPSLERRLAAMRLSGQVEARPSRERGTPYAVTAWLRQAVAPLAAAVHWERANVPAHTVPISPIDVEAGFLLAIPLSRLSPEHSGSCRLAVEVPTGDEVRLVGVLVGVEDGRIVSCATRHQGQADAWASGSASAWLHALIEHDTERLELGGDCHLAEALIDGLHSALFGARRSR